MYFFYFSIILNLLYFQICKHFMQKNKILFFLSLVMLINALGYGIIIPLMYPYGERFGFTPTTLSFLFVSYSLAQFIATLIIGRFSDRFGRKPMLLGSLTGTALSLVLMAIAPNAAILFLARIIDGLTGGNISVAQAVIADISTKEERVKRFGIMGAAFGFGFLVGPALGGVLSSISITLPFWIAAVIAFTGVIFGLIFLPETIQTKKISQKEPLFQFDRLYKALSTPYTGIILLISFLGAVAQNSWVLGFQSFTYDSLKLSSQSIGLIFTMIGLLGIIMQAFGIKLILKIGKNQKRVLQYSLVGGALVMAGLFFIKTVPLFVMAVALFGIVFAPFMPIISSLLSKATKEEDQGGIMGINQAYISLGQIIGPLLAGLVAIKSISGIFLFTSLMLFVALFVLRRYQESSQLTDL